MPTNQQWGTKAILDAPIREGEDSVVCEVNIHPDVRTGLPLRLRLTSDGRVWLNGHPFGRPAAMLSVLARKVYLMEQRASRLHNDS